jgi:hypothetical protein
MLPKVLMIRLCCPLKDGHGMFNRATYALMAFRMQRHCFSGDSDLEAFSHYPASLA